MILTDMEVDNRRIFRSIESTGSASPDNSCALRLPLVTPVQGYTMQLLMPWGTELDVPAFTLGSQSNL